MSLACTASNATARQRSVARLVGYVLDPGRRHPCGCGRATDVAGNSSAFSPGARVVIDTMPPDAPSFSLAATSDTGSSNTDGITKLATPTFTGKAEAGAAVTLLDGTTTVGTATATPSGAFTITASTLADGSHTLSVVAADVAGNVSAASADVSVVVDTKPPAAPSIPTLVSGSDTGRSSTDGITADATPTFAGKAEAGTMLYTGTTLLGSTMAGANGAWSVTSSTLADGIHVVAVRATDVAGNSSAFSPGARVVIDTMPPDVSISSVGGAETNAV